MAGASAGYSALKRFGESLMRQSERDPRLARAASQGYDLLNPVVHGTRLDKIATETPRPFYATSQPEHALQYTGGNARAGVGSPAKGGLLVPMVLKGKPLEVPFDVSDSVLLDNLSWLKELGIEDPEAFRKKVWELNVKQQMSRPSTQRYLDSGMTIDNVFGNSIGNSDRQEYPARFFEALRAITPGLATESPLLSFKHNYANRAISPKGKVITKPGVSDGDAILVADPSLARSPWAQFEEDGPGLMKAKGGSV